MDLGTSKTGVYMRDKGIVISQPSMVAYDRKTGAIVAVGNKARRMLGKTSGSLVVASPMLRGVISEYMLAERMIKAFIKNALRKRRILGRPNVVVTVPQGISEVERKAVEQAIMKTGAKETVLITSPIAAALGAGIDVLETHGHMIVDIGAGTTEISIIASGDIADGVSLDIAGSDFTDELIKYVKRKYSIEMGYLTAEDVKQEIGSVYEGSCEMTAIAKGKSMLTGLPASVEMTSDETVEAFGDLSAQIVSAIMLLIDRAGAQLVSDIAEEGIYLVGGGSLIHGMDTLISKRTGLRVEVSDEAENIIAAGTGMAGEYISIREAEAVHDET